MREAFEREQRKEQAKKQEAIEKADADLRLAQQKREEQKKIDEIEHEHHSHHASKGWQMLNLPVQ